MPPEQWSKNLIQQAYTPPPVDLWLQMWSSSLPAISLCDVPFTARRVCTPLSAQAWLTILQDHPDPSLVQFISDGICQGFHIDFTRPQSSLKSARNNLEGAQQHPDVVSDYLHSEVLMGRVVGSFSPLAIPCTCSHQQVWCDSKTTHGKVETYT